MRSNPRACDWKVAIGVLVISALLLLCLPSVTGIATEYAGTAVIISCFDNGSKDIGSVTASSSNFCSSISSSASLISNKNKLGVTIFRVRVAEPPPLSERRTARHSGTGRPREPRSIRTRGSWSATQGTRRSSERGREKGKGTRK